MENYLYNIINEVAPEEAEKETFKIDNDELAEWGISKIAEARNEEQRLISTCQAMIDKYKAKIEEIKQKTNNETSFIEAKLQEYFENVPHKETKTQESYKLPSGTLVLKKPFPEVKQDSQALLKWIKLNNLTKYVKVEEKANWGELKKDLKLKQVDNHMVTEDGEVVDGIELVERDFKFEIKL